ncbi:MAG: ankyrin repeat domain-containing protein [bacterium]|nr:ankyrin repeat domain-containing protein [bacterium]
MNRSKLELKNEFAHNKKVLDKLKKDVLKLLKGGGKTTMFSSGNVAKVGKMIRDNEELMERQLEIGQELVLLGEEKGKYLRRNLFEDVKNGDCGAIACSYIDGGELETKDKDLWTPLHVAALNGHSGVAEFLLEMGAERDSKNDVKQTPIHIAVSHNKLAVAEVLLKRGANPFARSKDNQCPHNMAVSIEMGKLLEEYEHLFIRKNIKEPKHFLGHCEFLLLCTVERKLNNSLELFLGLHDRGVDIGLNRVNEKGNTLLHLAVSADDLKNLELVLRARPYPFKKNKIDQYPIQLAQSKKVKEKMAEYEESYISEITGNPQMVRHMGGDLLLYCAEKGYAEAVEELIKFVRLGLIDIDVSDKDENTPLHKAVRFRRYGVAALLLKSGADMLVTNKHENMPADYVKDDKKLIRMFNNFERIWVNRIIQQYLR